MKESALAAQDSQEMEKKLYLEWLKQLQLFHPKVQIIYPMFLVAASQATAYPMQLDRNMINMMVLHKGYIISKCL